MKSHDPTIAYPMAAPRRRGRASRRVVPAALALLLLSARWAGGGIVFEQPHEGSEALLASSRYQPNGTDYDQFVWDSFSVPSAQAVTEIRWRGGYNPELSNWGGDILNFHVSIYESTPGLSQPHLGPGYPRNPATPVQMGSVQMGCHPLLENTCDCPPALAARVPACCGRERVRLCPDACIGLALGEASR